MSKYHTIRQLWYQHDYPYSVPYYQKNRFLYSILNGGKDLCVNITNGKKKKMTQKTQWICIERNIVLLVLYIMLLWSEIINSKTCIYSLIGSVRDQQSKTYKDYYINWIFTCIKCPCLFWLLKHKTNHNIYGKKL